MKKVKFTINLKNCSIYETNQFYDFVNSLDNDMGCDYEHEDNDGVVSVYEIEGEKNG